MQALAERPSPYCVRDIRGLLFLKFSEPNHLQEVAECPETPTSATGNPFSLSAGVGIVSVHRAGLRDAARLRELFRPAFPIGEWSTMMLVRPICTSRRG